MQPATIGPGSQPIFDFIWSALLLDRLHAVLNNIPPSISPHPDLRIIPNDVKNMPHLVRLSFI
jgi:hypothetical protein